MLVAFWQANLVYSLQPLWSTLFAALFLKVSAEAWWFVARSATLFTLA